MAVKKKKSVGAMPVAIASGSKWMSLAWVILLVSGLAHMLPEQMAPIVKLSVWGVTVQTVVGILSVVLALYFLLGED